VRLEKDVSVSPVCVSKKPVPHNIRMEAVPTTNAISKTIDMIGESAFLIIIITSIRKYLFA